MCIDELSDWRKSERTPDDLIEDLSTLVEEGLLEAYVEQGEEDVRFRLTAEGERCTTPGLVELVDHAG